jgi:ketosteroid isomerase-like protein
MVSFRKLLVRHKAAAIGIGLTVVLASWLAWYFSDRQIIKRQLTAMAWDINREPQESTMETAIKMRDVKAVLAPQCQVTVPETHLDESFERDMGIMYLMNYRSRYEMLAPSFEEMEISFPADNVAAVQATVLLKRQKQQGQPTEVAAPVKLTLQKTDGDWLLNHAELAAAFLD